MKAESRWALALVTVAVLGCSGTGDGIEPPIEQPYFPVGLSIDSSGDHLLVVNSNFDLQFNGGTIQSLDLNRVAAFMPKPCAPGDACPDRCGALSGASPASQVLVPGPCEPVSILAPQDGGTRLLTDGVKIGAFATETLFLKRPDDVAVGPAGRLMIPLRGNASLGFVDVNEDGRLSCGQNRNAECSSEYSVDNGLGARGDQLDLPHEPWSLAATPDKASLLLLHQLIEGPHVSVFEHDWQLGPRLRSLATLGRSGNGLAFRPSSIASVEAPASVGTDVAPFLVSSRGTGEVRSVLLLTGDRVGPEAPQVREVARTTVTANAVGSDSRGIVVARLDPTLESQAQSVFMANRSPASLLVGELEDFPVGSLGQWVPNFQQTVPLSFGPSRVVLGRVVNQEGNFEPRVFAICFDARLIYVYDPIRRRVETEIRTGRGPHAFVVDEKRRVGYIAHFTDSYVGVVDLDKNHINDYARVVLSVGTPTPPRASK